MSAAQDILSDSRLPELEARVFKFLCQHSGTLKLQATMDDLMQLIQQVGKVASAWIVCLAVADYCLGLKRDSCACLPLLEAMACSFACWLRWVTIWYDTCPFPALELMHLIAMIATTCNSMSCSS